MRPSRFILALLAFAAALAVAGSAFAAPPYRLTVGPTGTSTGNGTIVGDVLPPADPAYSAYNCTLTGALGTGDCFDEFYVDSSIQLAAIPASGYRFLSWNACPGMVSGPDGTICTFSSNVLAPGDTAIKVEFAAVPAATATLDIVLNGSGSGRVVGPSFNCPATGCVGTYPDPSNIRLEAIADPGSEFVSWGGAAAPCGASAICDLFVTGFTAASVVFNSSGGGGGGGSGGGAGGACDILGTPGNDILIGTAADEVICGRGGNDTIRGRGGDDDLRGEAGNDTIYGDAGSDVLLGGRGLDRLYGGTGPDTLTGGSGNDSLFGGTGPDFLDGKTGSDFGNGGGAIDTCARVETRVSCP